MNLVAELDFSYYSYYIIKDVEWSVYDMTYKTVDTFAITCDPFILPLIVSSYNDMSEYLGRKNERFRDTPAFLRKVVKEQLNVCEIFPFSMDEKVKDDRTQILDLAQRNWVNKLDSRRNK